MKTKYISSLHAKHIDRLTAMIPKLKIGSHQILSVITVTGFFIGLFLK